MKTRKQNSTQVFSLTLDTQNRLLAYTTAAGLGAFSVGQMAEAQSVESTALAPYPRTLAKGSGTGPNLTDNSLDIDGDGTADFVLMVDTWQVEMYGTSSSNLVLNPSPNPYVIPWTNGVVLNASAGSEPQYRNFLANSYYGNPGEYLFNDFETNSGGHGFALAFQFKSGLDGQEHFGYMNIQVNGTPFAYGDFTVTVNDIHYNATPNTALTIVDIRPTVVTVTGMKVGPGNSVLIDFTSTDNAAASTFKLLKSPGVGVLANWQTDSGAVITSTLPGVYQASTTAPGGPMQFYRISH